jgi:plastocyanin
MPMRKLLILIAAALALSLAADVLAATPTLKGTVGPGFTITLTQAGKKVKTLKAGTYTLVVSDKASIHNFVLEKKKGGTFEKTITSVPFTGTKTLKVKLTKGTYEYYCTPHETVMHADFTVT